MLRGGRPVKEMARAERNPLYGLGILLFGWIMVQRYRFEPLFLLEGSRRIRDAVSIPVGYVGGALSLADLDRLVGEGFAFVQMGRATIRDPDFVRRLASGEVAASDCDHCNRCVPAMNTGGIECICP
jgi:2,4-dienoyl-CoA reductase-like NADH-dependent reductase (Old Yellow Enzyme family)